MTGRKAKSVLSAFLLILLLISGCLRRAYYRPENAVNDDEANCENNIENFPTFGFMRGHTKAGEIAEQAKNGEYPTRNQQTWVPYSDTATAK